MQRCLVICSARPSISCLKQIKGLLVRGFLLKEIPIRELMGNTLRNFRLFASLCCLQGSDWATSPFCAARRFASPAFAAPPPRQPALHVAPGRTHPTTTRGWPLHSEVTRLSVEWFRMIHIIETKWNKHVHVPITPTLPFPLWKRNQLQLLCATSFMNSL